MEVTGLSTADFWAIVSIVIVGLTVIFSLIITAEHRTSNSSEEESEGEEEGAEGAERNFRVVAEYYAGKDGVKGVRFKAGTLDGAMAVIDEITDNGFMHGSKYVFPAEIKELEIKQEYWEA